LTTLEDVRRIQARLVKEYLAGRISTEVAKTGAYLTSVLTVTLKHLEPEPRSADWVNEVVIVKHELDAEEEKFIAQMNSNILPAPEGNQ
jgi:hypothetical protein